MVACRRRIKNQVLLLQVKTVDDLRRYVYRRIWRAWTDLITNFSSVIRLPSDFCAFYISSRTNDNCSFQCGNVTPRNILKESNDNGNGRRKSFTPKFFNLFALRGHATVTIPTTAQQQDEVRLSFRLLTCFMLFISIPFLVNLFHQWVSYSFNVLYFEFFCYHDNLLWYRGEGAATFFVN